MIRTVRFVYLFSLVAVICSMLAISANAQRQTRLVFCNEDDRTNDTISFPNRVERMGNDEFAPWEFTISDDVGFYRLRVASYQSFHPYIYVPNRYGEWVGRPVATKLEAGRDKNRRLYYYWDLVFLSQKRAPAKQRKYLLLVKPSLSRQRITATWKTTQCEETRGGGSSRRCVWISKGLYGLGPFECQCGGRKVTGTAAVRACGPYPKI